MIMPAASFIAGIGFFFAGLHFLNENMRKIAGRKVRAVVARWTNTSFRGLVCGTVIGAVTQSTSAGTFSLITLLNSGLIMMREAMPVVLGLNIGVTLLVYVAVIDVKIGVLFVIGITGVAISSERSELLRWAFGAGFGAALLFLGLSFIKESAAPLGAQPWFRDLAQSTAGSYAIALLAAALLAFLAQSAVTIILLAVTLTGAGVFEVKQSMMFIYGACVGSSVTTWVLALPLKGRARQLAMLQVAFNFIAAAVLVMLFYVEVYTNIPLIGALMGLSTTDVAAQMANLFALFNVAGVILSLVFLDALGKVLEKLWPPTALEDLGKLQYIHDRALADPQTAIELVPLEQARLLEMLPHYLEVSRNEAGNSARINAELQNRHRTFASLVDAIDGFLRDLGQTAPPIDTLEQLSSALSAQRLVKSAEDSVLELANGIAKGKELAGLQSFFASALEGMHALMLSVNHGLIGGDEIDLSMASRLTGDRSQLMQKLRRAYLSEEQELPGDEKLMLLTTTNLCERIVWLLGRLVDESRQASTPLFRAQHAESNAA